MADWIPAYAGMTKKWAVEIVIPAKAGIQYIPFNLNTNFKTLGADKKNGKDYVIPLASLIWRSRLITFASEDFFTSSCSS